jgi:uncharacterized protein YcbK (DUF882 family)
VVFIGSTSSSTVELALPTTLVSCVLGLSAVALAVGLSLGWAARDWALADTGRTIVQSADGEVGLSLSEQAEASSDEAVAHASLASLASLEMFYSVAPSDATTRRGLLPTLTLYAVNTQEQLSTNPFRDDGRPDRAAFAELNHLFRCRRTGDQVPVDPRLIQLLEALYGHFDSQPIQLISGYRRAGVGGTRGDSRHVAGRAADIRVPGVPLRRLARVAHQLGAGGIGFYPDDGFVHVDVRETPFYWVQRHGVSYATRPPHFRVPRGDLSAHLFEVHRLALAMHPRKNR